MANKAKVTITATDKTRAAFSSAQRNVEGLQRSFRGMAGGIAALVGAAGLGAIVKGVSDTADKIQKLSISLGVSTEALSQYQLVASRSGTTLDNLALIWQRQSRRIAEAAVGTGEAKDAIRELGLEATELAKLAPDRQFEAIAEAMQGVEGQSNRLRLAFKLFDSEGARPALQAMAAGADGIRAMRDEAEAMGLTLTRVEADQMAAFNDRMRDSALAIEGAKKRLVVALGPALIATANWLAEATQKAITFWSTIGGDPAQDAIKALEDERTALINNATELQETIRIMKQIPEGTAAVKELEKTYAGVRDRITEINNEILNGPAIKPPSIPAIDITTGGLPSIADEKAAQRAAEREAKEMERLQAQQEKRLAMILEYAQTEQEQLQDKHDERILYLEESYQNELIGFEAKEEAKAALVEKFEERRRDIEKKHADVAIKLRGDIVTKSLGFLRALGTKSEAFAKAALVIESIIAAKKIFIESQVAAMAALTPPPVGLGPVAGQPLAASILAMGKISAGMTLASGALSLASMGGGGAGGASGTFDADPLTGLPTSTGGRAVTRTDVTINLGNAGIFSAEAVRNLIEQINEQIDDGVQLGGIVVA